MTAPDADDRTGVPQQIIEQLRHHFMQRRGRRTVSVRCDLCGNREIATVRLIAFGGRDWYVYGTRAETHNTEAIVARRMHKGWEPNLIRAYALAQLNGVDLARARTRPGDGPRINAEPQTETQVFTTAQPLRLVVARCPVHGAFVVYQPALCEVSADEVVVVRATATDRISTTNQPSNPAT
jgi:hypothetical protein